MCLMPRCCCRCCGGDDSICFELVLHGRLHVVRMLIAYACPWLRGKKKSFFAVRPSRQSRCCGCDRTIDGSMMVSTLVDVGWARCHLVPSSHIVYYCVDLVSVPFSFLLSFFLPGLSLSLSLSLSLTHEISINLTMHHKRNQQI